MKRPVHTDSVSVCVYVCVVQTSLTSPLDWAAGGLRFNKRRTIRTSTIHAEFTKTCNKGIEVIKWKHPSKKDDHTCCVLIRTANAMTSPIVGPNTSTREDHPTAALP